MNKKFIIRKNEEIQEIVKTSKKIVSKYFRRFSARFVGYK